MVGNDAEVEIEIRNFAGDGPARAPRRSPSGSSSSTRRGTSTDLKRYRARGYAMKGNRIAIVIDRPMEVVEVHPPSVNSVNMAGVTVEYYPPRPTMGIRSGTGAATPPRRGYATACGRAWPCGRRDCSKGAFPVRDGASRELPAERDLERAGKERPRCRHEALEMGGGVVDVDRGLVCPDLDERESGGVREVRIEVVRDVSRLVPGRFDQVQGESLDSAALSASTLPRATMVIIRYLSGAGRHRLIV